VSLAGQLGPDTHTPTRDHVSAETTLADGHPGGHGDAFRAEDWRYPRDSLNVSVRTPTERYVFRSHDVDELFDLVADPGEIVNLADSPDHAGRRAELRRLLADEIGDSFAGARDLLLSGTDAPLAR
jgi:arylsulfatase